MDLSAEGSIMANENQLKILKQGVKVWNKWRDEHPDEEIDLSNADLSEIDLTEIDLTEAILFGSNLFKATLSRAKLIEAALSKANLSKANLSKANLSGAHLSWAQLSEANLSGAVLVEATLFGADLSMANLLKANLAGATLSRANLCGAVLSKTNLSKVALTEANLVEVDLSGAILIEVTLNRAILSSATITGATFYATARDEWVIDNIICDYVYWDKDGKERTPKDRDFKPSEFEELYKQLPTFDYVFEHGFTALDAVVMSRIVEAINEKHPEFELKLDSFHSRGQPHAKFTVLHKEHVEAAKSHVTNDYEARFAALEGQQDHLMKMFAMLVGNPQLPAVHVSAHLSTIRTLEEAQTLYTIWSQKIAELRRAYAIETDAAIKFKLKQQITENEADLKQIEERLEALEHEET
jgi:uncharacterized protein YjbI with pentapeptide repeats